MRQSYDSFGENIHRTNDTDSNRTIRVTTLLGGSIVFQRPCLSRLSGNVVSQQPTQANESVPLLGSTLIGDGDLSA